MSDLWDLQASRFSLATARDLAALSELSYRPEPEVRAVCDEGGLEFTWIEDERMDTQGFVCGDEDCVTVVFRGTESPLDWITDLHATLTQHASGVGRVHRGFYISYSLIERQLRDALKGLGSRNLLFTGHSLGGALAVLAASDFSSPSRITRLYTFGQPRVGDAAFIARVNARVDGYHRFVNNNDVVARAPLEKWGFAHGGRLNHLDFRGGLHLDPMSWVVFVDRMIGRLKDFGKFGTDGIKDHSMSRYRKLVADLSPIP